jgi:ABC-2 type transport system ATP-binding protein
MKALSVRHLTKVYGNGVLALKGIDLDVEEGEFFALLGPNGAGKSTTIGIVCSLIRKSAGSVSIFGHDLQSEPEAAKSLIGLVPQEYNFNVFEPVVEILVNQAGYYGIDRRTAYGRAEESLRRLGLWEKRKGMARELSGGMKRRLMIARALVHRPRLLILDEPTAGVDLEMRRSMWEFLREINRRGTTIILTTHYLEEAESLCRRLAIINEGVIVEDGALNAVLSRLHREVFVLNLKGSLQSVPAVPGYSIVQIDESTLEVEVPRERGINRLFTELSQRGVEVLSMRNKTNRLEEVFLRLVERRGIAPAASGDSASGSQGR